MRVSERGVAFIASHEGIVPYPYRDSVSVWTVGIGHTASAGPPNPAQMPRGVEIPMSEVIEIFRRDLRKFETRVNQAVKVPVSQHEFDALVSFDFNTGGIQRAQLTNHLNAGNRTAAASAFMGWSKPPEIIPRRTAEMNLFRSGTYGNGMANVYRANESGQVLWSTAKRVNVLEIMGQSAPSPPTPTRPATYTVQPGDMLSVIARRHDVSMEELAHLNGISDPNMIFPGQVLRLPAPDESDPAPVPPEPPAAPSKTTEPPSDGKHDPKLIALVAAVVAAVVTLAAYFGLSN